MPFTVTNVFSQMAVESLWPDIQVIRTRADALLRMEGFAVSTLMPCQADVNNQRCRTKGWKGRRFLSRLQQS